jgi:hypothetical protein
MQPAKEYVTKFSFNERPRNPNRRPSHERRPASRVSFSNANTSNGIRCHKPKDVLTKAKKGKARFRVKTRRDSEIAGVHE